MTLLPQPIYYGMTDVCHHRTYSWRSAHECDMEVSMAIHSHQRRTSVVSLRRLPCWNRVSDVCSRVQQTSYTTGDFPVLASPLTIKHWDYTQALLCRLPMGSGDMSSVPHACPLGQLSKPSMFFKERLNVVNNTVLMYIYLSSINSVFFLFKISFH